MEKLIFLICLVSCSLFTIHFSLAQTPLEYNISFGGSGAAKNVESVIVKNLTTDVELKLAGTDILKLVLFTGINDIAFQPEKSLKLYPNPANDYAFIEFDLTEQEDVIITVNDITGRELLRSEQLLEKDLHQFKLNGLGSGTYLIKLQIKSIIYTGKIISSSRQPNNPLSINKVQSIINMPETQTKLNKVNSEKKAKSIIEMNYSPGEILKLTGKSDVYATVVMLIPTKDETVVFNFVPCIDADKNNYPVVKIGEQIWMAKNLNVGLRLVGVNNQTNNNIIEKHCDYNKCDIYGGLYQWDEMMQYVETEGTRGICPSGWHIPSDKEWKQLEMYLGISQSEVDKFYPRGTNEGGKLKETGIAHWNSPNMGAINSSGFTALPAGVYSNCGYFYDEGVSCFLWTSSLYDSDKALLRHIYYYFSQVFLQYDYRALGFSVRCLKD